MTDRDKPLIDRFKKQPINSLARILLLLRLWTTKQLDWNVLILLSKEPLKHLVKHSFLPKRSYATHYFIKKEKPRCFLEGLRASFLLRSLTSKPKTPTIKWDCRVWVDASKLAYTAINKPLRTFSYTNHRDFFFKAVKRHPVHLEKTPTLKKINTQIPRSRVYSVLRNTKKHRIRKKIRAIKRRRLLKYCSRLLTFTKKHDKIGQHERYELHARASFFKPRESYETFISSTFYWSDFPHVCLRAKGPSLFTRYQATDKTPNLIFNTQSP